MDYSRCVTYLYYVTMLRERLGGAVSGRSLGVRNQEARKMKEGAIGSVDPPVAPSATLLPKSAVSRDSKEERGQEQRERIMEPVQCFTTRC